jgi:hypothetical protein
MGIGYGEQVIAVIPSKHLIAVQSVDLRQHPQGIGTRSFSTSCGKSVPLRPRADPDRAARSTRTAVAEQIFPT